MKCKEPAGTQSGAKSAWELVQQLSLDKQQSTYSRGQKSLGDSSPGLYCVDLAEAYVTQKKCQFKDLDKKKRYDTQSPNGRSHEKPSQRKAERGKNAGTYLVPVAHKHLTLRKRMMCSRNMGAHVRHGIWIMKGMKTR
jgi:hypothetical protein